MTKLHIGCGDILLLGYINCDIDGKLVSESSKEEIEANTTQLSNYFKYPFGSPRRNIIIDKRMNLLKPWNFKDNSIDEIIMISCFEHFSEKEGLNIIKEMKRILKVNGRIIIDVPDLKGTINQYIDKNPKWAITLIYCNGKNPYSFHRFGYTKETFKELWDSNYKVEEKTIVSHDYPILSFLITKIGDDNV